MKLLIKICCVLAIIFQSYSQQQEVLSPILFIYDASGSMWGQMDGKTKKEIAANVLTTTVGNFNENQNIGLIAYGHRKKGDCNDIEFLVDLKHSNKSKIVNVVKTLNPTGKTPLARSASMAINHLKDTNTKATIILITDGVESCDGNICNIVAEAKAAGIDFKLHIVGFGLKNGETEELKCAAKAGEGNYYQASNASGLSDVLIAATSETVDDPDGNVTVYTIKNGKPIDAWVKAYDVVSKQKPIAVRTYRDTANFYLPPGKYNFEVQPLEGSDVKKITLNNIESFDDKIIHKTVSFDAGTLNTITTNNNESWDCIVKIKDLTGKPIAQARTYGKPTAIEVNPGTYNITIQALGRLKGLNTYTEINNVSIKANETIPLSYNFESGKALIGVKTANGELIDATVNFYEINTNKNVAAARTYTRETNNPKQFILNPGIYKVKIITLGKHKGNSESFTITVKQGETTTKIITY
jgi:Ca-activated chloride channel family protein